MHIAGELDQFAVAAIRAVTPDGSLIPEASLVRLRVRRERGAQEEVRARTTANHLVFFMGLLLVRTEVVDERFVGMRCPKQTAK